MNPSQSVLAPAAAIAAAHLSINAGPFMLGAVVEGLGVDTARAGLLASVELVGFGFASLVTAPALRGIPTRSASLLALLVVVSANIVSILDVDFPLLAGLRVASGAGGGVLAAIGYAAASGMPDTEKQFAKCYAALFLSGMLCYLIIPPFMEHFVHRGVFGFIAGSALLLLPAVALMPRRLGGDDRFAHNRPVSQPIALLVAAAMLVTFSDGLIWPMTERIGDRLGMGSGHIGLVLACGTLTGMLGLVAAGRLGRRAGSLRPILIGIWGTALAGLIIANAGTPLSFILGAQLKNPFYFLALPYIMALATRLDRAGRVSAVLGGLLPVGAGLGPWLAGWIADRFGFAPIGWIGILAVAAATSLLLICKRLQSHRP